MGASLQMMSMIYCSFGLFFLSQPAPFALWWPWWVFQRGNKSAATADVQSLFFETCGNVRRIYTNSHLCNTRTRKIHFCSITSSVCWKGIIKTFAEHLINLIFVTIIDQHCWSFNFPKLHYAVKSLEYLWWGFFFQTCLAQLSVALMSNLSLSLSALMTGSCSCWARSGWPQHVQQTVGSFSISRNNWFDSDCIKRNCVQTGILAFIQYHFITMQILYQMINVHIYHVALYLMLRSVIINHSWWEIIEK